ncbi:MAG: hypothetical protein E7462_00510 [Ruminococcaceae bacterium]|nr:hypothetical protein [Oscillospiraceae bacterium]
MFGKRKYEFKPDRGEGTLKKLYLTPIQRKRLLKWGAVSLVLVVLSLLQDVVLCRIQISGSTFDMAVCGILLCGMFFDPETTAVFTLISSTLYYFSGTAPGTYSIALITGLGTLLCIFRRNYLQRCFSATMLCAAAGMFLYELGVFAIGWFVGNTTLDRLGVFALCGVLSVAVMPLLYPLFLSISNIGGESWKE